MVKHLENEQEFNELIKKLFGYFFLKKAKKITINY